MEFSSKIVHLTDLYYTVVLCNGWGDAAFTRFLESGTSPHKL
jgi:hypothetical protein